MSKERILALAETIEHAPKGRVLQDIQGFDMTDFTHHCGTPACIAGWSIWEFFGRSDENLDELVQASNKTYSAIACEYLGIPGEQGEILFFPEGFDKPWNEITQQEAARVLRNLAETGQVDWSIIDE